MPARYPLPRLWLVTDERQGDMLWSALASLPRGSGIIVRHYSLEQAERRELFQRIRTIALRRRHMLLLAGDVGLARRWRADGFYSITGSRPAGMIRAVAVHDRAEILQAERRGADLLLLSPLFPTRSHPGAPALGTKGFVRLANSTRLPVIALGGVEKRHRKMLGKIGAYGWAGIDAFIPSHGKA